MVRYGRWAAPYWFVGMELVRHRAGLAYESCLRLGSDELVDCKHLDTGFTGWHSNDQQGK